MSPEGQKPSENHLLELSLIAGIVVLSQFACSRPVRRKVHERDKVDVWDGSTENLEVAHIQHNRDNPLYNSEENARLLSRKNHYIDHYNREGRNGLTIQANRWSLRTIWARLTDEEKSKLPPPPEE